MGANALSCPSRGCQARECRRSDRQREAEHEETPLRLEASAHVYNIVNGPAPGAGGRGGLPGNVQLHMSPTWIWMQVAIVVFVLAGMIIAITKLV